MNHTRDVELNRIGVLKRREIETRISAPLVDALSRKFDREKVLQIVRETIVGIEKDLRTPTVIVHNDYAERRLRHVSDYRSSDTLCSTSSSIPIRKDHGANTEVTFYLNRGDTKTLFRTSRTDTSWALCICSRIG